MRNELKKFVENKRVKIKENPKEAERGDLVSILL